MNKNFIQFFIVILLFLPQAKADILLEGWYKILSANVHVGYIVNRYEFKPESNQYIVKSFIKTSPSAGDLTESLVTISKAGKVSSDGKIINEGFEPISFKLTSLIGKKSKIVDGKLIVDKKTNKKILMTNINEDGKTSTKSVEYLKDSFFSEHLNLFALKRGLKIGLALEYDAIAEESLSYKKGKLWIKEVKKLNGQEVYRVINRFGDEQFISLLDKNNGQIIATKSPTQGLQTVLVMTKKEATGNIQVPLKSIKSIFGDVPGK